MRDIEPNYGVHLQVAAHIKAKKANTPREAAVAVARLTNHRNPHVAILALASSTPSLPKRPPPFPGPVMSCILELIHTWKNTICVESRWKEDLGNNRDMHRLLTFKGYRLRELNRHQSPATPPQISKPQRNPRRRTAPPRTHEGSCQELEGEDHAAQSAKLQELIRRGTPRDLVAAQELMKALSGANPDAKPDYRTQALTELSKLEQK
ncbi:hypothetical protein C0993_000351, partial [Termitomyces sp. T159_Od127]